MVVKEEIFCSYKNKINFIWRTKRNFVASKIIIGLIFVSLYLFGVFHRLISPCILCFWYLDKIYNRVMKNKMILYKYLFVSSNRNNVVWCFLGVYLVNEIQNHQFWIRQVRFCLEWLEILWSSSPSTVLSNHLITHRTDTTKINPSHFHTQMHVHHAYVNDFKLKLWRQKRQLYVNLSTYRQMWHTFWCITYSSVPLPIRPTTVTNCIQWINFRDNFPRQYNYDHHHHRHSYRHHSPIYMSQNKVRKQQQQKTAGEWQHNGKKYLCNMQVTWMEPNCRIWHCPGYTQHFFNKRTDFHAYWIIKIFCRWNIYGS